MRVSNADHPGAGDYAIWTFMLLLGLTPAEYRDNALRSRT